MRNTTILVLMFAAFSVLTSEDVRADKQCKCWIGVEEGVEILNLNVPRVSGTQKKRQCSKSCSKACQTVLDDPSRICSILNNNFTGELGCFSVVGADDNPNNKWDFDGRPCKFCGCSKVCVCPAGETWDPVRQTCGRPICETPDLVNGDLGGDHFADQGVLFIKTPGIDCVVSPRPCSLEATATVGVGTGCDRFGGFRATVSIFISGGSPPYSLVQPRSQDCPEGRCEIEGLSRGTHQFVVTDNAGSLKELEVVIEREIEILVDQVMKPSCCSCADGAITISTSLVGAVPPITFRWSPGDEPTPTITGLAPGSYRVTATDAEGCFETREIILSCVEFP